MITEDYVSFETAKLLKEKGFDENCAALYDLRNGEFREKQTGYVFNNSQWDNFITAPTLQMAKKWVRKVYNLFIEIQCYGCEYDEKAHFEYSYVISEYVKINTGDCTIFSLKKRNAKSQFLSPEQACEAAIKYCLENLI